MWFMSNESDDFIGGVSFQVFGERCRVGGGLQKCTHKKKQGRLERGGVDVQSETPLRLSFAALGGADILH